MIEVRTASVTDVASIVRLGKELRDSSAYANKSFSDEKATAAVTTLVISDTDIALVAEEAGIIMGFLLGGLTYEWFSDDLFAFDYSVYVVPHKRNGRVAIKFFKAFEQWALQKGAVAIQLSISTNINVEKNSCFYQWLGYEVTGKMFEKRL